MPTARVHGTLERPTPAELAGRRCSTGSTESVRELPTGRGLGGRLRRPVARRPAHRRRARAVNIPLHELDFRAEMAHRLGLPVSIENDANAAAYAEFTLGAGRGATDLVC